MILTNVKSIEILITPATISTDSLIFYLWLGVKAWAWIWNLTAFDFFLSIVFATRTEMHRNYMISALKSIYKPFAWSLILPESPTNQSKQQKSNWQYVDVGDISHHEYRRQRIANAIIHVLVLFLLTLLISWQ